MGCHKILYHQTPELRIIGLKKTLTSEKSKNNARSGYLYGFNGMPKDNEITVDEGSYDFGARIYDSRLGRWLSLDPHAAKYPNNSPYNFCNNSPIITIDIDGKDGVLTGSGTKNDPYIIVATYAYVEGTITSEMATAVNTAVSQYNSSSNTYEGADGKKVYVQYKLEVKKYNTQEELDKDKSKYNFTAADGTTKSSLNVVEQMTSCDDKNSLACASGSNKIGFITSKIESARAEMNATLAKLNGTGSCVGNVFDLSETLAAAMVHEIFHNLGGLHSDLDKGVDEMGNQHWAPEEDVNAREGSCRFSIKQNLNMVAPSKKGVQTLIARAKGDDKTKASGKDHSTGTLSPAKSGR